MNTPTKRGCNVLIGILVSIIPIFLLLDWFGNYAVYRSEPYLEASTSIEESKQKDLFVCRTMISPEIFKLEGSNTSFEESWIEKQSHYTSLWPTETPKAGNDYLICFKNYSDQAHRPLFLDGFIMSAGLTRYDILSEADFKKRSLSLSVSYALHLTYPGEPPDPDSIPVEVTW